MEIPDKIPGKIATKITISGIEIEEDDFCTDGKKEIIKIPNWLFEFITSSISKSYTQGGEDKIFELRKLLKI